MTVLGVSVGGVLALLVVCALLWMAVNQIPAPFTWLGRLFVILVALGWFLRLAHVWTGHL